MNELRTWHTGDPEPEDVTTVRDAMGDVWTREPTLAVSTIWTTPGTIPMTWERIAKKYGPLTEIDPSSPETRRTPQQVSTDLDDLARLLAEGMAGEVEKINAEAVAAAADAAVRAEAAEAKLAETKQLVELLRKARAVTQLERDTAREKLVELSDMVGDDDPCHDHVNHSDVHRLLNQVRKVLASYFAEPVTDRKPSTVDQR